MDSTLRALVRGAPRTCRKSTIDLTSSSDTRQQLQPLVHSRDVPPMIEVAAPGQVLSAMRAHVEACELKISRVGLCSARREIAREQRKRPRSVMTSVLRCVNVGSTCAALRLGKTGT